MTPFLQPLKPLNRRGGVAVVWGMAAPTLLLLLMGGLDCSNIIGDHARARSIAEAAALMGARDLSVATGRTTAAERAAAFAEAQIAEWTNGPRLSALAAIVDMEGGAKGVRVQVTGRRPSFFGTLLPPGGWFFTSSATATTMGTVPLCVIAHGDGLGEVLTIKDRGSLAAPACLIHSNEDIKVDKGGSIAGMAVQAVAKANGPISPEPTTDAPILQDPFKDLSIVAPAACAAGKEEKSDTLLLETGEHTLAAGVHCTKIEVAGTAVLRFLPGEHWFIDADFVARDTARITGEDVVLFFDKKSKFEFKDQSLVALEGRDHGQYAGFVLASTRDNDKEFLISSDHVEMMHGVIYIPRAKLIVEGKRDVGRESAWTVLVAQRLELKGNPTLFVNADYEHSDVPVPAGVGPRREGSRLVR